MNLHEGANVVVAVFAEVVFVANPFVKRCVELWQKFGPMVKIIGSTCTKGKTPELCFNISRDCKMR